MIVFDLRCATAGHVFEAWFGSSGDYDDQQARKLISCPICGDPAVDKAPMAAAVPAKASSGPRPEEMKQMLGVLAEMQKKLVANSDWVGDRFASEARAIHLGEAEARQIHGRASKADADSLIEDGIPVAPLPLPIAPPEEQN